MSRSHIYFIPFPAGGHPISTMHTATMLASPDLIAHFLVLSEHSAAKWLKACGQTSNPDLNIKAIADGRWQDWQPSSPAEYVMLARSPEFAEAVDSAIVATKQNHPNDRHMAMVFNGLMGPLVEVGKRHGLKRLLLTPTPYYMGRLAGFQKADGSSKPTDIVTYRGLGGSKEDVEAVLGDAFDLMGPMFFKMFLPTMKECQGTIYSNTNEGLEGEQYQQLHLPDCIPTSRTWMIGPILPPLYERALDDTEALHAQLASADRSDPVIDFLDKQPPRSVVYIAFGSVVQISSEKALLLIRILRKYNQRWVLLHLNNKENLEALLGEHEDGLIISWAPQLQALLHPATKCVISHSGFGTMIEGIYAGQPCISSPISSDNFLNTKVMQHLGICVGNIAINRLESVMTRASFEPSWPDDDGKLIDEVFSHAFGNGSEEVLTKAREAALALRQRMVQAKKTKGVESLADLRAFVST